MMTLGISQYLIIRGMSQYLMIRGKSQYLMTLGMSQYVMISLYLMTSGMSQYLMTRDEQETRGIISYFIYVCVWWGGRGRGGGDVGSTLSAFIFQSEYAFFTQEYETF